MGKIHIIIFLLSLSMLLQIVVCNFQWQDLLYQWNPCDNLQCKKPDICIISKFRCLEQECPILSYCGSSEDYKRNIGPDTCDNVICSPGHVCRLMTVVTRNGRTTRAARCEKYSSDLEIRFTCKSGTKCSPDIFTCMNTTIFCSSLPCRLRPLCAHKNDVNRWMKQCLEKGCTSESRCFLSMPFQTYPRFPNVECLEKEGERVLSEECTDYVCPAGEECVSVVSNCKDGACEYIPHCIRTSDSWTKLEGDILSQEPSKDTTSKPDLNKQEPDLNVQEPGVENQPKITIPEIYEDYFDGDLRLNVPVAPRNRTKRLLKFKLPQLIGNETSDSTLTEEQDDVKNKLLSSMMQYHYLVLTTINNFNGTDYYPLDLSKVRHPPEKNCTSSTDENCSESKHNIMSKDVLDNETGVPLTHYLNNGVKNSINTSAENQKFLFSIKTVKNFNDTKAVNLTSYSI